MKRGDLLRHLRAQRCRLLRERRRIGCALLMVVFLAVSNPTLVASARQVPSCAVGSWRASYPEIQETFRGMMRPYRVEAVTGDVLYTIDQDGSFELRYDQLTVTLQSDAPGSIAVDGIIRGVLEAWDPGFTRGPDPTLFQGTLTDLAVSVDMVLGEERRTMTVDSLPEMRGSAPHECASGLLMIGIVPWPDGNWVRFIFRKP